VRRRRPTPIKEAIMAEAEARPPFGASSVAETANSLKEQASTKAKQVAEQARTAADSGKDEVASRIGQVAQAFHRTGDQLRGEEQEGPAQFTDAIGNQIDRIATYLQTRDVRGIVNEVENFARRQPALFIGGAFTVGLFAARFLKSSAQHPMRLGDDEIQDLDTAEYGTLGYGATSGYQQGAGYAAPATSGGYAYERPAYGGTGTGYAEKPSGTLGNEPGLGQNPDRGFGEGRS
jgi:hypothetical protein